MNEVLLQQTNNQDTDGKVQLRQLLLLIRINLIQMWRKIKAIRQQSKLLVFLTGSFLIGYIGLAFFLFFRGLSFVGKFPGFGAILIERLLFLLFAILFVLLLFSNLVISYTNLFKNRESQYLVSMPITSQTLFRWKFIESTLLASWAFLFLIAPFLAAYGLNRNVSWHFYPVAILLIGLFIILPAVAGAYLAVIVARHLEKRTFQLAVTTVAISIVVACVLWLKPTPLPQEETRVLAVLDRLLSKTSFVEKTYLPSYWLSAGILNWAEGAVNSAALFIMVLFANTLFFGFLAFTKIGDLFYDSFSAVQSRGTILEVWFRKRKKQDPIKLNSRPTLLERFFLLFWWLRPETRALLVKDVRLFWRDTTQWAQTIILFGLLGVYIVNLRHFTHQLTNPFWVHLVSYLNLMACALNLATLTTRFIYPQFSLEGKRLWIIGMAPAGIQRLIMAKYWLASFACLVVTLGLMFLSCRILKMATDKTLFFAIAVSVMTFALNGMAIGLGVLYPNLKEDNPSKIVSGFGGTFCLVLSFLYILASVVVLAIGSPWSRVGINTPIIPLLCWITFAVLSVGLGVVPLRLGLQRLSSLEI